MVLLKTITLKSGTVWLYLNLLKAVCQTKIKHKNFNSILALLCNKMNVQSARKQKCYGSKSYWYAHKCNDIVDNPYDNQHFNHYHTAN